MSIPRHVIRVMDEGGYIYPFIDGVKTTCLNYTLDSRYVIDDTGCYLKWNPVTNTTFLYTADGSVAKIPYGSILCSIIHKDGKWVYRNEEETKYDHTFIVLNTYEYDEYVGVFQNVGAEYFLSTSKRGSGVFVNEFGSSGAIVEIALDYENGTGSINYIKTNLKYVSLGIIEHIMDWIRSVRLQPIPITAIPDYYAEHIESVKTYLMELRERRINCYSESTCARAQLLMDELHRFIAEDKNTNKEEE